MTLVLGILVHFESIFPEGAMHHIALLSQRIIFHSSTDSPSTKCMAGPYPVPAVRGRSMMKDNSFGAYDQLGVCAET